MKHSLRNRNKAATASASSQWNLTICTSTNSDWPVVYAANDNFAMRNFFLQYEIIEKLVATYCNQKCWPDRWVNLQENNRSGALNAYAITCPIKPLCAVTYENDLRIPNADNTRYANDVHQWPVLIQNSDANATDFPSIANPMRRKWTFVSTRFRRRVVATRFPNGIYACVHNR